MADAKRKMGEVVDIVFRPAVAIPVTRADRFRWANAREAGTVYALVSPDTLEVRYVGKVRAGRTLEVRLAQHVNGATSGREDSRKARGIRKMIRETGRGPAIVRLSVADEALGELEKAWIRVMREAGARLWNTTDGGDSSPTADPEIRAKAAAALRSVEVRAKMSATIRARVARGEHPSQRPEVRAKVSAAQRAMVAQGEHPSQRPETRAKLVAAQRARVARGGWVSPSSSPEARAKLSAIMRAKVARGEHHAQRPDVRARHSATMRAQAARGDHSSQRAEVRAKLSAALRERHRRGENPMSDPEKRAKAAATRRALFARGELVNPRGEDHVNAKLTADAIHGIRRRLASGESQRSIARAFEVSQSIISGIKTGRCWAWLR